MKLLAKTVFGPRISFGLVYKPMMPFAVGVADYEKEMDEAIWSREQHIMAAGVWARQHPSAAYWLCRVLAAIDYFANLLLALVPRPEWHVNDWRRVYGITWLRFFAGVMVLNESHVFDVPAPLTEEQIQELIASSGMWCAICGHKDHGSWTCGEMVPVAGVGMSPCPCSMSSPTPEKPNLSASAVTQKIS